MMKSLIFTCIIIASPLTVFSSGSSDLESGPSCPECGSTSVSVNVQGGSIFYHCNDCHLNF